MSNTGRRRQTLFWIESHYSCIELFVCSGKLRRGLERLHRCRGVREVIDGLKELRPANAALGAVIDGILGRVF